MTRPAMATMAVLLALAGYGTVASAAPVRFSEAPDNIIHLTGALGTDWRIFNKAGTDSGLPSGSCVDTAPGLGISDALFDPSGINKGDAYDNGFTFWVDNQIFASPDVADLTGQTFTSGPQTMSGLEVTVQYTALQTLPVLRMVVAFHNPTAATIRPRFRMVTNVGSDGNTTLLATSNGDRALQVTDTWVASSDNTTMPTDAPQAIAICGPPNPFDSDSGAAAPPSCFGPDEGAFNCNGTQGITASFIEDVLPGRTIHYMFFGQLAGTNQDAVVAGYGYGATPERTSELIADLSDAQLLTTWNWNFFGERRLYGGGPGGGTSWSVWNSAGTNDPVNGFCDAVPGLAVYDARLVDPQQSNAFDDGVMLYVDGQPFASPLDPPVTDNRLLAGPVTMSGLDVTVEYAAIPDAPTLRSVFSFTNPTDTAISTTALLASNLGADDDTLIHATSSGDTTLTAADRWVATGDASDEAFYVHVTHVLFGPEAVTPPTTVVDKTFECIREDSTGVAATFNLTIPAGETRRLVFFNDLHTSGDEAVAAAALYDTTPAAASSRVAGLDVRALLETVNWTFCSDGSFDSVGCRLEALRADVVGRVADGTLQASSWPPSTRPEPR